MLSPSAFAFYVLGLVVAIIWFARRLGRSRLDACFVVQDGAPEVALISS
jgi:hypothetical protein